MGVGLISGRRENRSLPEIMNSVTIHQPRVGIKEEGMELETLKELESRVRRELPGVGGKEAAELARVVGRLVAALKPQRIYVFGSQARGEAMPDSDIDLLLVVPAADQPSYRLAQAAYHAAAPHSLALDILVMPAEEFAWRSRAVGSLPATVLREGRILYAA